LYYLLGLIEQRLISYLGPIDQRWQPLYGRIEHQSKFSKKR
jgi:hypothetical protein